MIDFSTPEWSDIEPIKDSQEPQLAAIQYDPEYALLMSYLRVLIQKKEYSTRALEVTSLILGFNASHYSVWKYRLDIITNLKLDPIEEFDFLDSLVFQNPKSFQIWHQRMHIMSFSKKDPIEELSFINSIFENDGKNYHAWSYRLWLVTTYSLWEEEVKQLDELIKQDPRNNSCWNQRYRIVESFGLDVSKEIDYVIHWILQIPDNESTWNYFFALMDIFKVPSDKLEPLLELKNRYSLLLSYKLNKSNAILDQLKEMDPARTKYYEWLQIKV
jgi:protein farnesyltransferase/geranylgeranyltransferase type-1 subunit alpha